MSLVRKVSLICRLLGGSRHFGATGIFVVANLMPLAMPLAARAQQPCGMVATPQGDEYWPCPAQANRAQAAPEPDVWGAIALSSATLVYGTAWKFPTEQAAKSWALKDCSGKGARDCKVAVTVADICVALAISKPEKVAAVSSPTGATNFASGNATLHCQRAGGGSCKIAISFCADGINHQVNDPADAAPFGRH
jgi:hypothetical protein